MIFKEAPAKVGYVSKPHGVHGGMVVITEKSFSNEPEWPQWIFIDIEGGLVPYPCQSENCFQKDDNSLVIFIRGAQKSELVTELIDHEVYFPGNLVDNYQEMEWTPSSIIGFRVKIEDSPIVGEITDWMDIPGNPLVVVKWDNRELLIPAHDEFIKSIDFENKSLIMILPEGLISL